MENYSLKQANQNSQQINIKKKGQKKKNKKNSDKKDDDLYQRILAEENNRISLAN